MKFERDGQERVWQERLTRWVLVLAALWLAACQTPPIPEAQATVPPDREALRIISGLQAPEDIESLPNERYLLFSQFGGLDGGPGSLVILDRWTEQHRLLYPLAATTESMEERWGDPQCPSEPGAMLSPHGIHLSQREDGRWQLLVVNHGGRESVEFFELLKDRQDPDRGYQLQWRGCAVAPADSYLNDVVALPDGRVLVTHMFNRSAAATPEGQAEALAGRLEGWVWQWRAGQGFSELPGSRLIFPNGLQVDAVGRYLFINLYGASQVVKLDLRSGEVVRRAAVPRPDNSSWAPDGRLLVASHTGEEVLDPACTTAGSPFCPLAFQIVALDPDTLHGEVIFHHAGAPMGGGTIAVQHGQQLYIGSFVGDRLLKVDLDAWQGELPPSR